MKRLITLLIFFLFTFTTFSQVNITTVNNGADLTPTSPNVSGGWAALSDIIILETGPKDIKQSQTNATIVLTAPNNWQFNVGQGSVSLTSPESSDDISSISMTVSSAVITITFSTLKGTEGKDQLDEITISGIQVQPVDPGIVPSQGEIVRTGGTAAINGLSAGGGLSLGTLSLDSSNPLPVELTSFSANISERNVNLQWTTATEINNYGFEIQRSVKTYNWEVLGFIEGHGNSNSPKAYSFTDNNISSTGTYSYRLKKIDNDGSYEFSKTIGVDIGTPITLELRQNYPNPFNPSTTISFTFPESGNVSLKIFNTLGEEITTLVNGYTEAGIYSYNFNAENLPSGFYIYQLKTNENSLTKKMLFLK